MSTPEYARPIFTFQRPAEHHLTPVIPDKDWINQGRLYTGGTPLMRIRRVSRANPSLIGVVFYGCRLSDTPVAHLCLVYASLVLTGLASVRQECSQNTRRRNYAASVLRKNIRQTGPGAAAHTCATSGGIPMEPRCIGMGRETLRRAGVESSRTCMNANSGSLPTSLRSGCSPMPKLYCTPYAQYSPVLFSSAGEHSTLHHMRICIALSQSLALSD
jgi:hypothetical protein